METAVIINQDQLERCKSDILKEAEKVVDNELSGRDINITYQLKNCIAYLPPENTVFMENAKYELSFDRNRVPSCNIVFCFEGSDGKIIVAYGKANLDEGSFSNYLNNDLAEFIVTWFDSEGEATEYISNNILTDNGFTKVDFTID